MAISIFDQTMANMTWPEVERSAQSGAVVLIPLGVIEQHGPHLALGTDTFSAHSVCCLVKQKLEYRGKSCLIAPPFYWGVNQATGAFPGSFSSRESTMSACLYDICASLASFGFKKAYGVNFHGDPLHMRPIVNGFRDATGTLKIEAKYAIDRAQISYLNEQFADMSLTGDEPYILPTGPEDKALVCFGRHTNNELHAGGRETACMMAFHPETVRLDIAKELPVVIPSKEELVKWVAGEGSREMTPRGYVGAPAEYVSVDGLAMYMNQADLIVKSIMEDLM